MKRLYQIMSPSVRESYVKFADDMRQYAICLVKTLSEELGVNYTDSFLHFLDTMEREGTILDSFDRDVECDDPMQDDAFRRCVQETGIKSVEAGGAAVMGATRELACAMRVAIKAYQLKKHIQSTPPRHGELLHKIHVERYSDVRKNPSIKSEREQVLSYEAELDAVLHLTKACYPHVNTERIEEIISEFALAYTPTDDLISVSEELARLLILRELFPDAEDVLVARGQLFDIDLSTLSTDDYTITAQRRLMCSLLESHQFLVKIANGYVYDMWVKCTGDQLVDAEIRHYASSMYDSGSRSKQKELCPSLPEPWVSIPSASLSMFYRADKVVQTTTALCGVMQFTDSTKNDLKAMLDAGLPLQEVRRKMRVLLGEENPDIAPDSM